MPLMYGIKVNPASYKFNPTLPQTSRTLPVEWVSIFPHRLDLRSSKPIHLISFAFAADVAAGAVESGDFSERFLQEYVARCEKEFNYDLKSALKFANFAYGHRDLFLKALWRDNKLFMEYMRTARGDRTYTEFNRWCARRSPVTLAKLIIGR